MENILRKITSQEKFSRAEAKELLIEITESKYSDEQISAILTAIMPHRAFRGQAMYWKRMASSSTTTTPT